MVLVQARQIAPGVVLTFMLAFVAKQLTEGAPISPVLVAIAFGIVWRNTIGVSRFFEAGLQWVTQVLLRIGIALVGFKLTLAAAAHIAGTAIPVVLACIATALVVATLLRRALAIPERLSHLLAIGTAVCGCTAIAALSPAIRARPEETACALMCVVLFGCAGMLCYPWLAAQVFPGAPVHAGVFLGTAIHDTSQVIGAALIYSEQANVPDVLAAASATKLIRNLSLALLVPLAAWRYADAQPSAARISRADTIPVFVVAFIALVIVRTVGDILFGDGAVAKHWETVVATGQTVSELCMICGMAGVGFSLSLTHVRAMGWRAFAAGLLLAASVGVCSIVVTLALSMHT